MKVIFDTSVWVDHLRAGALTEIMPALRGRFSVTIETVAMAELLAGCRNRSERRVVEKLFAPFERAGRVLHPAIADFTRAATALSFLRQEGKTLKKPGSALLDGLIAAVAYREGALLVTSNRHDFELLASRMPFKWESFAAFRTRLLAQ